MKKVTIIDTLQDKASSPNNNPHRFQLALVEGSEPSALSNAVSCRTGYEVGSFYVTLDANRLGTVVPLTSFLEDGMELYLHFIDKENEKTTKYGTVNYKETTSDEEQQSSCLRRKSNDSGNEQLEEDQPKPPKSLTGSIQRLSEKLLMVNHKAAHRPIHNPFWSMKDHKMKAFGDIYYVNQLGTDLANERTLLAWIRTMLACIRTLFAYEKQYMSNQNTTLFAANMMISTLLLLTGFNAAYRYYKIRWLLQTKEKPKTYNAFSLMPFILLALATSLLTSIETFNGTWL